MKHVNEFNSFETNEGLLDDMKAKVKKGIIRFGKSPKLRTPEEVSREDWDRKREIHDEVPYNEKELEFFKIFNKENKEKYSIKKISPSNIDINNADCDGRYSSSNNEHPYFSMRIIKLDDDWYVIVHHISSKGNKFYICDEWEEVLGYLKGCIYKFKI